MSSRAEGRASSSPFGTRSNAVSGLMAALITSFPHSRRLWVGNHLHLKPRFLQQLSKVSQYCYAIRGLTLPSPVCWTYPGSSTLAPVVVTPSATLAPRVSACRVQHCPTHSAGSERSQYGRGTLQLTGGPCSLPGFDQHQRLSESFHWQSASIHDLNVGMSRTAVQIKQTHSMLA